MVLATVLAVLPGAAWAHTVSIEGDAALARGFNMSVLFLLSSLLMLSVNQFVFASGAEQIAQLAIPLLVVNTSFLNVRSGDGPQYTVVLTVVGGTELPVLGANSSNQGQPPQAGQFNQQDFSYTLDNLGAISTVPRFRPERVYSSTMRGAAPGLSTTSRRSGSPWQVRNAIRLSSWRSAL